MQFCEVLREYICILPRCKGLTVVSSTSVSIVTLTLRFYRKMWVNTSPCWSRSLRSSLVHIFNVQQYEHFRVERLASSVYLLILIILLVEKEPDKVVLLSCDWNWSVNASVRLHDSLGYCWTWTVHISFDFVLDIHRHYTPDNEFY